MLRKARDTFFEHVHLCGLKESKTYFGHLRSTSGYGNFEDGLIRVKVATVHDVDLAGVTHLLVSGVAHLHNSQCNFSRHSSVIDDRAE